ncbi:MAG: hypothetical protein M1298_00165, partial [Chloroflexi bacterium]|nr:hypothetical protein [Chloroflexota bacterium]
MPDRNPLHARATLPLMSGTVDYYRLSAVAALAGDLARLPITVRIFLESVLRHVGNGTVQEQHVIDLARWQP